MNIVTGKNFKKQFQNEIFLKYIYVYDNKNELKNKDYTYSLGLNIIEDFYHKDDYGDGGFYFTNETFIESYKRYGNTIFRIDVPNDAIVICSNGVYKTNKLIILEKYNTNKNNKDTQKYSLTDVNYCGLFLENIQNQTKEICLKAVRKNGWALKFVQNQTDKICLEAVKKNRLVIDFVKNKTFEIRFAATRQKCYALKYMENIDLDVCLGMLYKNGLNLQYITEQYIQMCTVAVLQNPRAIFFVKNQSKEFWIELFKYLE